LARYAIINREFFKDKFVLELGSGTGITSCKNCLMSDYLPEVVENARKNCRDNGMQKAVVMKMNWKDYMSFNNRYDIIIGAEIVSPGGPLQELYLTLNRFLV
jgi:predicted nicotinamide N-methyase